jgi:CHASE1-domain containing sensor protein
MTPSTEEVPGYFRSWLLRHPRTALLVAFIPGIAVSLTLYQVVSRWEWSRMESGFERAAEARSVAVKEEIDKDLMLLRSLAAFHKSSERITRQQFQTFVKSLAKNGAGIQALEWIPRVSHAERARYEEQARAEGFPNFRITEMSAEGKLIPAASRPEYYPVFYVEPYAGNEAAIGFDLASDPLRKKALDSAMETGEMLASAPLVLVQETGHQHGFLVFLPVYRTKAAPQTVQERRANLAGF